MSQEKLPKLEPLYKLGTIDRAFEEGVLIGSGFRLSTHVDSIGISETSTGAFEMGLEQGRKLAEEYEDIIERAREAGFVTGAYKRERRLLG